VGDRTSNLERLAIVIAWCRYSHAGPAAHDGPNLRYRTGGQCLHQSARRLSSRGLSVNEGSPAAAFDESVFRGGDLFANFCRRERFVEPSFDNEILCMNRSGTLVVGLGLHPIANGRPRSQSRRVPFPSGESVSSISTRTSFLPTLPADAQRLDLLRLPALKASGFAGSGRRRESHAQARSRFRRSREVALSGWSL